MGSEPWWLLLLRWLAEVFLGQLRQTAAEQVRNEIEEKTDAVREAHREIDSRPTTADDAFERLLERSRARKD